MASGEHQTSEVKESIQVHTAHTDTSVKHSHYLPGTRLSTSHLFLLILTYDGEDYSPCVIRGQLAGVTDVLSSFHYVASRDRTQVSSRVTIFTTELSHECPPPFWSEGFM